MCSHCSTSTYESEHVVFDFLFLCQFAKNDGFQIHPCPYKGHKLIVFYGCIVFHGIYVLHFPSPVYRWWAFGLVPGLCHCKQCHNEPTCACVIIVRIIYNPLGIYPVMGLLGQMVFLVLDPWGIATLSYKMIQLIYTPTHSVRAFLFLPNLTNICCFLTFK